MESLMLPALETPILDIEARDPIEHPVSSLLTRTGNLPLHRLLNSYGSTTALHGSFTGDFEEMKASHQISEEEGKKVKDGSIVVVEAQKRISNEIFAHKNPSSEVSFFTVGLERKPLEVVTREALGLLRPLIRQDIEKYFADIGLEAEFVSHNSMPNLCGGQKVKVVLGAATPRHPHLFGRADESLAALIKAVRGRCACHHAQL
ncbi:hypothetical protein C8Q80DRAFT_1275520 [Daedaleopsis nitida]|nr:hypothetical protein C8Q80DRAFT_1275520 [Daedaleopsis nitida]